MFQWGNNIFQQLLLIGYVSVRRRIEGGGNQLPPSTEINSGMEHRSGCKIQNYKTSVRELFVTLTLKMFYLQHKRHNPCKKKDRELAELKVKVCALTKSLLNKEVSTA